MKRLVSALAAAAAALTLCSCGLFERFESEPAEKAEGQELIEASMKKYNEQDSGGYEAVDNLTGKLKERFVYRYDEIGFLSFLSEVYDENGSVDKVYNSGYAVWEEKNGVGEKIPKKDERFVLYERNASRYSKATDAVFGFIDQGIDYVATTDLENGAKDYMYVYDPEEAGVSVDGGEVESYSLTYRVDSAGEVISFRQEASGKDKDGDFRYDFTITLIDGDSVGLIENPITVADTADKP